METLYFDPLDIELGDLDIFEGMTGKSVGDVVASNSHSAAEMKALYYLVKRQNDHDFTVEQLARTKLRDVVGVADAIKESKPNPTTGGDAS